LRLCFVFYLGYGERELILYRSPVSPCSDRLCLVRIYLSRL